MRRVIVESPFAGNIPLNVAYARLCIADCLRRGEAPIASHLLHTQPGILDDNDPAERAKGMAAGFAWTAVAQAVAVYTDFGISAGMRRGIEAAERAFVPVEYRQIGAPDCATKAMRPFPPKAGGG